MTDTADAAGTARQCIELAEAGSEMVRVTVNLLSKGGGESDDRSRSQNGHSVNLDPL